eukprot:1158537-Pelagomonas_calceolata.AAC.8
MDGSRAESIAAACQLLYPPGNPLTLARCLLMTSASMVSLYHLLQPPGAHPMTAQWAVDEMTKGASLAHVCAVCAVTPTLFGRRRGCSSCKQWPWLPSAGGAAANLCCLTNCSLASCAPVVYAVKHSGLP